MKKICNFIAEAFEENSPNIPSDAKHTEQELQNETADHWTPFDSKFVGWENVADDDERKNSDKRSEAVKVVMCLDHNQNDEKCENCYW